MARRTVIITVEGPERELDMVEDYIEDLLRQVGLTVVEPDDDDEED